MRFHGRYTILSFLGAGAMGEVYKAVDNGSGGGYVALKLLRDDPRVFPESLERFRDELRLGRDIAHPNVCPLYHVDQTELPDGTPVAYLVMQFLEGTTLDRVVRGKELTPQDAAPIVAQLLDGLDAVHASGIVHGDLKCANVMLVNRGADAAPCVVIMDFGLARSSARNTSEALLMGTPAYLPPEQIRCEPLSPSADIHALGVMVFRMLTGRFPFEGRTAAETMEMRLHAEAPTDGFPQVTPREWSRAILECLERDPHRRPTTVDLRRRLDLDGRTARRRRRAILTLGLCTAGAGAFAGWRSWRAYREWVPPQVRRHMTLGEDFLSRRGRDDFANARLEFESALKIMPTHAPAWVALAEAYAGESNWGMAKPSEGLAKARQAAQKAIELDDSNARAYAVLGYSMSIDVHRWLTATPYFDRALALDPENPQVLFFHASHLSRTGKHEEAIAALKKVQLLAPQSLSVNHQLASTYFRAGKKAEFLSAARELVRIQPNLANSHLTLAKAQLYSGNAAAALEEIKEAERYRVDEPQLLGERALIAVSVGDHRLARQIHAKLRALVASRPLEFVNVAAIPAALGDAELAVDDLEEGLSREDSSILQSPIHPLFASIRRHPRFVAFMRKLGLDPR
jgi:tetratricopeptide (TPR) repeat protein